MLYPTLHGLIAKVHVGSYTALAAVVCVGRRNITLGFCSLLIGVRVHTSSTDSQFKIACKGEDWQEQRQCRVQV